MTSLATWLLSNSLATAQSKNEHSKNPNLSEKAWSQCCGKAEWNSLLYEQVGRFSRSEWKTNTCQWGNRFWHNISIQWLSCWFTLVLSLFLSLSLFSFYTSSISRFLFLRQCRFSTFIPVVPPLRKAYFMLSSLEGLCHFSTAMTVCSWYLFKQKGCQFK